MSETEFIRQVMSVAKQHGWLVHHDFRSARQITRRDGIQMYVRSADPGFPDLVLLHPARYLLAFVECKSDTTQLRVEQADWIEALRLALHPRDSTYVGVWRPRDLDAIYLYLATGNASKLPTY